MKKLILVTTAIFLAVAFAPKKKEFLPPGTAKINDTLYADQVEINNFGWQEYEVWIKNKFGANSPEHISVLPDTLVWRDKNSYNEPYVQYYYRHPAYRGYPVVGISYEQAIGFCKWRTERVKEFMCISKKYPIVQFEYRLPTKKEWEFLSSDCINMFKNGAKNEKGQIRFNHRWAKDTAEWMKDGGRVGSEVLAPAYSYWPNAFKLYNMLGNVAEMVSEKGVSKGGAWNNVLEECRIGKEIPYEKPTSWLGFRCVCVVKRTANS